MNVFVPDPATVPLSLSLHSGNRRSLFREKIGSHHAAHHSSAAISTHGISPGGVTSLTAAYEPFVIWSSVQRFKQGSRWPTNYLFHTPILELCRQQRQYYFRAHPPDKDGNTCHTPGLVGVLPPLCACPLKSMGPLHLARLHYPSHDGRTSVQEPRQTIKACLVLCLARLDSVNLISISQLQFFERK